MGVFILAQGAMSSEYTKLTLAEAVQTWEHPLNLSNIWSFSTNSVKLSRCASEIIIDRKKVCFRQRVARNPNKSSFGFVVPTRGGTAHDIVFPGFWKVFLGS